MGTDEIALTRTQLQWPHVPFEIPAEVYQAFDARESGQKLEQTWQDLFNAYQKAHPELASELLRRIKGNLPQTVSDLIQNQIQNFNTQKPNIATRKASQEALNLLGPALPEFLGGSADLGGSNLTFWKGATSILHDEFKGNYLYYGVREFGMSAIANGLALHRGFIPYVATFLVFTDYARNAIRMSAIMKQRVIYVMTHDSIGLGEDGPTHQPIEHISSLRLIPNLAVWRPCDATETLIAWQAAISHSTGPSLLALSRQNLPTYERTAKQIAGIVQGGYILSEQAGATLNLIATGSEVQLVMQAQAALKEQGIIANVISIPCLELFMSQAPAYQKQVLQNLPMLVVEAGSTGLWYKLVRGQGTVLGIDCFGESAKAEDLFKHFGFTVEHVVAAAKNLI